MPDMWIVRMCFSWCPETNLKKEEWTKQVMLEESIHYGPFSSMQEAEAWGDKEVVEHPGLYDHFGVGRLLPSKKK